MATPQVEGIWGSRASERTVLAAMWLSGAAGYPNAEMEVHSFACMCALPKTCGLDEETFERAVPAEPRSFVAMGRPLRSLWFLTTALHAQNIPILRYYDGIVKDVIDAGVPVVLLRYA
jgi:hypothetical protein